MSVKKKYPQLHGFDNIYLDAAAEALEQAQAENENLSYALIINDGAKKYGAVAKGDPVVLASTLVTLAKKDEGLFHLLEFIRLGLETSWAELYRIKENLRRKNSDANVNRTSTDSFFDRMIDDLCQ